MKTWFTHAIFADVHLILPIHLASCNRKRTVFININLQSTPSNNVQETSHVVETTDTMNAGEMDIIRVGHNLALLPPHEEVSRHATQSFGEIPGNEWE